MTATTPTATSIKKYKKNIDEYLKSLGKKDFYKMIYSFADKHQDIANYLEINALIYKKDFDGIGKLVQEHLSTIWEKFTSQSRGTFIPDYSQLTTILQILLDAGNADLILDLGNEIIEDCKSELEEFEDSPRIREEKVIKAFAPVLEVIKSAIADSSLSEDERLLWVFDATLFYGTEDICQPLIDYMTDDANKDAWDPVVDILIERMEDEEFEDKYAPGIRQWCKYAFEAAGREDELPYEI